jgi:hypothetical protein
MLATITLIAIILTFVIMVVGTFAMIKGGEFNKKYSNILMRSRVAMQAISIILLFLLYMS